MCYSFNLFRSIKNEQAQIGYKLGKKNSFKRQKT